MTPTANGLLLLRAEIVEPQRGNWTATIDVDTRDALSGAVELDVGGVIWSGSVVPGRSGLDGGHVQALLEGGAGGLRAELGARYYAGTTAQTIIDDVLRDTGEQLDDSGADLLSFVRPRWHRTGGWAAGAITQICEQAGWTWRITRAGKLWVGVDSWAELAHDAVEVDVHAGTAARVYAPHSAPDLRPGVTYRAERVSSVITIVSPSVLRQEVWIAQP